MQKIGSVLALLVLGACSTTEPSGPVIHVRTVSVPESRTPRASEFSTVLEVEITNNTGEKLTVDRIQLSSVSVGTFTVLPVTERPQKVLAPGATEVFRLWAQVQATATIADGLDPILMRGSVEFLGPAGSFRKTFAQQVNPSTLH